MKINFKNPQAPANWGQINKASWNLSQLYENDSEQDYYKMRDILKFQVFDEKTYNETSEYVVKLALFNM